MTSVAGLPLTGAAGVSGGDICRAMRATTADGRAVFVKTLPSAPTGFFAAEARGIDLLRVPGGPPLPDVLAVGDDGLVLAWIDTAPPTADAAARFGRGLATMHATGPGRFGAAQDGFIGPLPLDNRPAEDWPTFYGLRRLAPFVGALGPDERRVVEQVVTRLADLAGPAEPPARIHGDLWSGNLVWGGDGQGWLVDAASAHGGHRETDLAMLDLFGAPHLDTIRAAYQEVAPLAAGWQQRTALHQLHPLLVHAQLFGGPYSARAAAAARAALHS